MSIARTTYKPGPWDELCHWCNQLATDHFCEASTGADAPPPLDVERLIDVMDWHMDSCLLKHRTRTNLEHCIPKIADEYARLRAEQEGEDR